MIKGRWVILAVLIVAVVMGIATWPLLRIRRRDEIHRTEAILKGLRGTLEQYKVKYGVYPSTLRPFGEVRDAWGRQIQCGRVTTTAQDRNYVTISLWSLGPNSDDSSDDIYDELPDAAP